MIDRFQLPQIQVRIGESNPFLQRCLRVNSVQSWMILTAWNPMGNDGLSCKENHALQEGLLNNIQDNGLSAIPMWGLGDRLDWAAEPSYLIFSVNRLQVQDWMNKFQQNACVYGSISSEPELIFNTQAKLDAYTRQAYECTTYQSAPLFLHHGRLCQVWMRACSARRVSIENEVAKTESLRLHIPLDRHVSLCFLSH